MPSPASPNTTAFKAQWDYVKRKCRNARARVSRLLRRIEDNEALCEAFCDADEDKKTEIVIYEIDRECIHHIDDIATSGIEFESMLREEACYRRRLSECWDEVEGAAAVLAELERQERWLRKSLSLPRASGARANSDRDAKGNYDG